MVPILVGVPLMASCNHLPPRHLSCKLPDVSNIFKHNIDLSALQERLVQSCTASANSHAFA